MPRSADVSDSNSDVRLTHVTAAEGEGEPQEECRHDESRRTGFHRTARLRYDSYSVRMNSLVTRPHEPRDGVAMGFVALVLSSREAMIHDNGDTVSPCTGVTMLPTSVTLHILTWVFCFLARAKLSRTRRERRAGFRFCFPRATPFQNPFRLALLVRDRPSPPARGRSVAWASAQFGHIPHNLWPLSANGRLAAMSAAPLCHRTIARLTPCGPALLRPTRASHVRPAAGRSIGHDDRAAARFASPCCIGRLRAGFGTR